MTTVASLTGREALQQRLADEAPRIEQVRQQLLAELGRIDLAGQCQGLFDDFSTAELRVDPFDKSVSLHAFWRNSLGMNQGSIQIQENGQVFAEYDVLVVHPAKPKWFIEAVTAWGNDAGLKSELRLIPVPGA